MPELPRGVVGRPRLFAGLTEALVRPIITVTGPAGWGKTQLIASWLSSSLVPESRTAWLSVERSDADPLRFWPALMTAISRVRGIPSEVDDPTGSAAPVVEALLSIDQPTLIVLDDIHHLHDSPVAPSLARLLGCTPPSVRIVLVGQYLPDLPLARLRVEQKLTAFTAHDLAFTESETRAMLAEAGLDVPDNVVSVLRDRTEGWSAGLRLAVLSLTDGLSPDALLRDFGGDHIDVADYLMSEVLARLPADVEEFLLRTSICNRLTGDLAVALTGRPDSANLLRWMARHNVFTTTDGLRRPWFRYHTMLGELLRSRLDQLGAAEVRRLHLLAAQWFAANALVLESFDHAAIAEEWTVAATIITRSWLSMYLDGQLVSLSELIDRVPEPVAARTGLDGVRTAVGLALGDPHQSVGEEHLAGASLESYPDRAAASEGAGTRPVDGSTGSWDGAGPRAVDVLPRLVVDLERARLSGDLAGASSASHGLLALADSPGASSLGRTCDLRALAFLRLGMTEYWAGRRGEAEAHLRESLSRAVTSQHPYLHLACLGQLALVLTAKNRLDDALRESRVATALVREHGWEFAPATAELWHALGWTAYMRGDLDLADRHLEAASLAVRRQDAAVSTTVLLVQGLVANLRGRPRDAHALLDEAETIRGRIKAPYVFGGYLTAERARVRLALGDIAGAHAILDPAQDTEVPSVHRVVVRAELLVVGGEPHQAIRLLEESIATNQSFLDQHLQALVLLSVLRADLGEHDLAITTLRSAITLAAPERFVQPFLQFGHPVESLLRAVGERPDGDATFIAAVLARAAGVWPTESTSPTSTRADALDEQLTRRELDVIRALDSLASLREISASLFVSVNTLKAHLRSIYRKLDVNSRREAVARARELRLR